MKNKGFTLMEVIVVVAIIVILLGIAAIGANSYLENADINERESVAETTYLAFQEYLTSLKKTGNLEAFNKSINKSGNVKKLNIEGSELQSILQNHYSGNYASYYSIFKENHEDCDIVSVVFSNGKKEHPLYNVLLNSLGDTDKLNNAFAIEYNQTTGVVMSVFYSKEVEAFSFDSMYGGDYMAFNNIIKRDEDSIISKKQGYYGVYNTSNKGEAIPESFYQDIKATINNDDRLYICFDDESIYSGKADEADISYLIELYTKNGSGAPFSTMTVSRKDMKGFNDTDVSSNMLDYIDPVGSKSIVNAVYKSTYDTLGNNVDHVLILLDCIHTNNFQNVFREKMKIVDGITEPEKCEIFANVSILINGAISGSAVTETTNPVFEKYDEANDVYTISCTRHLNNIRYFSDKNNYLLTDNINMKQFEREENDKNDASLDETDRANRHWYSEFEPITFKDLAGNTVTAFSGTFFGYKDESVELNSTKEECYSIKGLTINKESDNVGLFHTVKSVGDQCRVGALTFLDSKIEGKKNVGILCGESATPLTGIYIEDSYITGLGYIGGIVGKASGTISKCAASGNLYVESTDRTALYDVAKKDKVYTCLGGLIGYTTGTIENCNINSPLGNINYYEDEDYLYGNAIGGIAGVSEGAIKDCEVIISKINGYNNAGGIVGIPYCDLTNCDVTFESMDVAGYSGGVCGTAYSPLTVKNCNTKTGTIHMYYYDSESKYCGGIISTIANRLNPEGSICERDLKDGYLLIRNCNNNSEIILEGIKNNNHISDKPAFGYIGGITAGNQTDDDLSSSTKYNGTVKVLECINNGKISCDKDCYGSLTSLGGVVGTLGHDTTISKCVNNGDIVSKIDIRNIGGIVGELNSPASLISVLECDNFGSISTKKSMNNIGGIVGSSYPEVGIGQCVNKEDAIISSDGLCENIGGIIGFSKKGIKISGCENDAVLNLINNPLGYDLVTELDICVGGVIGKIDVESYDKSIDSSSNKGDINIGLVENAVVKYVGGIIGNNYSVLGCNLNSKANIFGMTKANTNYGKISVLSTANFVGGFAGNISGQYKMGDKDNSNSGFVNDTNALIVCKGSSGSSYIGGAIGSSVSKGTIYYCINNSPITVKEVSCIGGLLGYDGGSLICASKNIGEINVTGKASYIGGLIGYEGKDGFALGEVGAESMSCKSTMDINVYDGKASSLGGLIGMLEGSGAMYNTSFEGKIQADLSYSGGAVGKVGAKNKAYIEVLFDSCVIKGEIVSDKYIGNSDSESCIGGLIGYGENNTITLKNNEADNLVTINHDCSYAGGFIGYSRGNLIFEGVNSRNNDICINNTSTAKYISSCIGHMSTVLETQNININGNITVANGANYLGGIVGYISNECNIYDINYEGNITLGADSKYIGSIIGYQDTGEEGICLDYIDNYSNIKTDISCEGTLDYAGGVVGYAAYGVDIWGVSLETNFVSASTTEYLGGLIGATDSYVDIYKLTFGGNIKLKGSANKSSLLVGYSKNNIRAWDTYVEGEINIAENSEYVGGICGKVEGISDIGNITYKVNIELSKDGKYISGGFGSCNNITGNTVNGESDINVNSNAENVGILAGYTRENMSLYAEDGINLFKGDISINGNGKTVGGIVGSCISKFDINDDENESCISRYTGNIYVGTGADIGGIAGYIGDGGNIYKAISEGYITANDKSNRVGGLVGRNKGKLNLYSVKHEGDIVFKGGNNEYVSVGLGYAYGYSMNFDDVNVSGSIVCKNDASTRYVGGICGCVISNVEDGNKFSITNSNFSGNIDNSLSSCGGFVGEFEGCNLYIADSTVGNETTDFKLVVKDYGGGISGRCLNKDSNQSSIEIRGCRNYNDIVCSGDSQYIGGICGYINLKNAIIGESNDNKYTVNYGNITANEKFQFSGGIVGSCMKQLQITHCINYSDLSAKYMYMVGGIVGYSVIRNSSSNELFDYTALYSTGDITLTDKTSEYVGGLFGYIPSLDETDKAYIYNSYCSGNVYAGKDVTRVARIAGYCKIHFVDCYVTSAAKGAMSTLYGITSSIKSSQINSTDYILNENSFKKLIYIFEGDSSRSFSADNLDDNIIYLMDIWSSPAKKSISGYKSNGIPEEPGDALGGEDVNAEKNDDTDEDKKLNQSGSVSANYIQKKRKLYEEAG